MGQLMPSRKLPVYQLSVGLVAAIFFAGSAVAKADIISVNFQGSQNQATYPTSTGPTVSGSAGAVQESVWNNAPGAVNSAGLPLSSDVGSTSAVLTWSSSNLYNAYSGTPPTSTGDYDLMQGYLDYFSGGTPGNPAVNPAAAHFVTVTGLGAPFTTNGYEVLVYQNTDSVGSFGYTITDSNSNTSTAYGEQFGTNGA